MDCLHVLNFKINLKLLTLTVCYFGDPIKGVKWVAHVVCVEEKRNTYRILVGKLKVKKRSLGKPRHRRKENIRQDLKGAYWEGVDWIDLAQCRDYCVDVVNTAKNSQVSENAGNVLTR